MGDEIVATVHGDDITICGGISAVEFLIRVMLKKYEIKKQVIGEDPDLEKSGRILNRVIEWNRDGITIEAGLRHAREILKGIGLERANRSATPCAVERRGEGKVESRRGQGQTQTGHKWDNANNSDDRDRPQMADDDRGTNQLLVAGSTRSQVRVNAGVLCGGKAHDARHGTRQEDCTILRREVEGKVLVPLAAEW